MFIILKKIEKVIIQLLMIMMIIVLCLATIDVGWIIIKDLMIHPYIIFSINQLFDIFGLFMLVLIGIELLETIMKTYTTQNQPLYDTVISVAIIGIASIVLALTAGYFFMKKSHSYDKTE